MGAAQGAAASRHHLVELDRRRSRSKRSLWV